jgi:broad specificity phosphatase PhoE
VTVSLVYETHSLTEDNERGHATGWLPGKLSAEGRRLAAELGERRRADGIAAVFCSDLARAVETAEIAFAGSAVPVFHDWRLRECNYGELNGAPVSVLRAARRTHLAEPFPGGQSYADVVEVTRAFLLDLLRGWDGQRVCLISHSANKWALDVLLCGQRLEDLVDADFGWREGWEYVVRESARLPRSP